MTRGLWIFHQGGGRSIQEWLSAKSYIFCERIVEVCADLLNEKVVSFYTNKSDSGEKFHKYQNVRDLIGGWLHFREAFKPRGEE